MGEFQTAKQYFSVQANTRGTLVINSASDFGSEEYSVTIEASRITVSCGMWGPLYLTEETVISAMKNPNGTLALTITQVGYTLNCVFMP